MRTRPTEHAVDPASVRRRPASAGKIRPIAFYLPQFHPIPENDAGGARASRSGPTSSRARPLFAVTTSRTCRVSSASTTCGCPRFESSRRRWRGSTGSRLLLLPLLVRWPAPAGAAVRRGAPQRRAGLPVLPLLGERELDPPLGRLRARDPDRSAALAPRTIGAYPRALPRVRGRQRYIRVDGRPLFLVYRAALSARSEATADTWREECMQAGIGEIFLCNVRLVRHRRSAGIGFDAAVEFQPNLRPLLGSTRRSSS